MEFVVYSYFNLNERKEKMTPEQKIKHSIIIAVAEYYSDDVAVTGTIKALEVDAENIDESYDVICEQDLQWDSVYEMREGQVETDVACKSSRHYESKSVAMQMPDNSWVGWTYWFGGGKHAEPDAIDWMNESYDLDCKSEEKLIVVREFSKAKAKKD